jgi:hypothetical protein
MPQLVSPGLSVTVSDESQYVPSGPGTVPLILIATAQDKLAPSGSAAAGTSKSRAGALQAFGSQRELINAFGYPSFKTSAGSPIHGHELNEYGLQTAYSAMGLGNRAFVVRADIDLDQLHATEIRPTGTLADGTDWFDLTDTTYGIFEWDAVAQAFVKMIPILNIMNMPRTHLIYAGNVGQKVMIQLKIK